PERVGDHVRHVLYLGSLVIMGQDRRPPFGLEREDFRREVRHDTHPLVEETAAGGPFGQRLGPPKGMDRSQQGARTSARLLNATRKVRPAGAPRLTLPRDHGFPAHETRAPVTSASPGRAASTTRNGPALAGWRQRT